MPTMVRLGGGVLGSGVLGSGVLGRGVAAALALALIAAVAATAAGSGARAQTEDPVPEWAALFDEPFSGAEAIRETFRASEVKSVYTAPVNPDGWPRSTLRVEGRTHDVIYEVDTDSSTLEIYADYKRRLVEQGFEVLFECEGQGCGGDLGFAFAARRGMTPLPSDSRDQRYGAFFLISEGRRLVAVVTAMRAAEPNDDDAAFVVVETIFGPAQTRAPDPSSAVEIGREIAENGSAAIYGVLFLGDTAELSPATQPALVQMAAFLAANPGYDVALVGHTDASIDLETSLALSVARAASVRQALVSDFGVSPERVTAHGVGFLAPRATNETPEGRALNRRIEIILR